MTSSGAVIEVIWCWALYVYVVVTPLAKLLPVGVPVTAGLVTLARLPLAS